MMRLLGYERDCKGRWRKGTWQQSYTGQAFYALDPRVDELHYDDMVVGLSREARYCGQTRDPYYVAEHAFHVGIYAGAIARERGYSEKIAVLCERYGHIHDSSESWLGDISRPLKHQRMMRGYRKLEEKWDRVICDWLDVHPTPLVREIVHEADSRIVLDETEALMIDPDMWPRNKRYLDLEPLGVEIMAWSSEAALNAFTQRFCELWPDFPETRFFPKQHARDLRVV